jgi:ATP adenylyltransferase
MKQALWTPWRMPYIRRAGKGGGCVFCAALARRSARAALILSRGRTCFAILNKYPYTSGHLMVAPVAHRGTLEALTDEERLELMSLATRMTGRLQERLKPHGFNLGINLGRVAGAGVLGHLHLHVVPRWKGDANFMPAVGGVRLLPMGLPEAWRRLTDLRQRKRR